MDGDTKLAVARLEAAAREASEIARKALSEVERIKSRALLDGYLIKGDKGDSVRGDPGAPGLPGKDGIGIKGDPGQPGKQGPPGVGAAGRDGRDGKDASIVFAIGVIFEPAVAKLTLPVLRLPYPCAVRAVRALRTGGMSAAVTAGKLTGESHIEDLYVFTPNVWTSITAIKNAQYAEGETLAIGLVSPPGAGAVEVQVEFVRS